MKKQAYILKRQILFMAINIFIIICLFILKQNNKRYDLLMKSSIWCLVIIITITFLPLFHKKLGYPSFIHGILYDLPLFSALLEIKSNVSDFKNISCFGIFGSVLVFFIIYFNRKEYLQAVNSIICNFPISRKEWLEKVISSIYCITSEEIFFRGFFVGRMKTEFGCYIVLISSLIFVLMHYINRWSNVMYTRKSYLLLFILSCLNGTCYYYTDCLLVVIFIHCLYNSADFIVLVKRLRARKIDLEDI